jgi:hypothetical protein
MVSFLLACFPQGEPHEHLETAPNMRRAVVQAFRARIIKPFSYGTIAVTSLEYALSRSDAFSAVTT